MTGGNRQRLRLAAALLVAALVALLAGGFLPGGQSTRAGHNPPVATFAIDVDPSGSVSGTKGQRYRVDPNSNGTPEDNSLAAGKINFCIKVSGTGKRSINVVGKNMLDTTFYDIRFLYNAKLVAIAAADHTPFLDNRDAEVGFINLPWNSQNVSRKQNIQASNIDNTKGNAFMANTWVGTRNTRDAPDVPHTAADEPTRPYRAAVGGVPLVRLTIVLKDAAAGRVVRFNLTNSVTPANDYGSYDSSSKIDEVVAVPESNLIDGAIAVAPATCAEAPPTSDGASPGGGSPAGATVPPGAATPGEEGESPAPGTTAEPGTTSTPVAGEDGESPGPPGASPGEESPSTGEGTAVSGEEDGDGISDAAWQIPLFAGVPLLALATAIAVWRWRRGQG
ncbi:MAG: hypothetical protein HYS09_05245 [Chloroflexi bacterium]|nr:hypothetical protein [Chloroflexota bacterium]